MPIDINTAIFRLFIGGLIGAIIGLEREKTMELNNEKSPIGIRTDILSGILGGSAVYLGQLISPWVFLVSLIAIIVIGLLPILQNHDKEKLMSYKTSISFILVFLMGGLAFYGEIQVALAVAIIATFVLSLKYTLHRFIYGLNYEEIIDAVKFIIIAFIILPFLPNQSYDQKLLTYLNPPAIVQTIQTTAQQPAITTQPVNKILPQSNLSLATNIQNIQTDIINPYNIWLLIVIISGLNFLGYILVRLYGRNKAYSLTGLIGGFYSSTITALNLATASKKYQDIVLPFVSGILLACGSSFLKMFILIRTLNATLFERLFPSMGLMCLYLIISGSISHFYAERNLKNIRSKKQPSPEMVAITSPLNLKSAIKLTLFVICTMIGANLILHFADINVYYVLAGLMAFLAVDDPIIIATAGIAGTAFSYDVAKNIILGVIFLNFLQKLGTAYFFGNRKLVKPLALGFSGLLLVTIGCLLYL